MQFMPLKTLAKSLHVHEVKMLIKFLVFVCYVKLLELKRDAMVL